METLVLGLNLSHNPSATLSNQNGVICAYEEEKLRQEKGFIGFPEKALDLCLSHCRGTNSTLYVAIGFKDLNELCTSHRFLLKFSPRKRGARFHFLFFDLLKLIFPNSFELSKSLTQHFNHMLSQYMPNECEIWHFDHHDSHASSASSLVDWQNFFLLTLDGKGDGCSGSLRIYKEGMSVYEERYSSLNSLGLLYSSCTASLGFRPNRHEGKITGLAAFGESSSSMHLLENELTRNGKYFTEKFVENLSDRDVYNILYKSRKFYGLNRRWIRTESNSQLKFQYIGSKLKLLLDGLLKKGISKENVARAIQDFCENQVTSLLSDAKMKYPEIDKICLAGGFFANVKANQRIFELGFRDIFVTPAMDDAGTAIGASALMLKQLGLMKWKYNSKSNRVYWGRDFENKEIEDLCNRLDFSVKYSDVPEFEVANLLSEGKIIGVFSGRGEWGPRALGNRSIFCQATDIGITEELNNRLGRNDFMPFAPIVLDVDFEEAFPDFLNSTPLAANYMTITSRVSERVALKFPAIVHIDGTARPQLVDPAELIFAGKILKEYKKLTGYGILLNTSFNLHESPIIEKPLDALKVLEKRAVDVVVFDNLLVKCKEETNYGV
jgi:carbamoyltransferase